MNSQIRYYFDPPNATEAYPGANYSNYIYLTQVDIQETVITQVKRFLNLAMPPCLFMPPIRYFRMLDACFYKCERIIL